jgi:hypothetical protein
MVARCFVGFIFPIRAYNARRMPQGRQSHLDAALTFRLERASSSRHFDRFTGCRKLALPRSRWWALCAHGRRDCRDKPRDEEMAVTSFAPLRLAGFLDGPPRQSKQQCHPLDVSSPRRHAQYGRKRTIRGRWKNTVGDSFWRFLVLCRMPVTSQRHDAKLQ